MTDKLAVYNTALGHLGQRRFSSLSQPTEQRRALDDFWDQVVAEALSEAQWKFMLRSIQIDSSATVEPAFGWKFAFNLPDDWVRTILISSVETFIPPLLDYAEEAGFWYSNWTPLFVKYVSSDVLFGLDLGSWPANFTGWVAYLLAQYSCRRITGSGELLGGPDGLIRLAHKQKLRAKSTDAMNDPPGQIPTGTWARSRRGFLRGLPAPGGSTFDD